MCLGTYYFIRKKRDPNLLREGYIAPSEIVTYTSDIDFITIGFPLFFLYSIGSTIKTPFKYHTKLENEGPKIDAGIMVLHMTFQLNEQYFPSRHHQI